MFRGRSLRSLPACAMITLSPNQPAMNDLAAPFVLKVIASGQTLDDIEIALEEALRLVWEGYTSSHGNNDTGAYSFELTENLPV